jgi:signal transduction histidine kinase
MIQLAGGEPHQTRRLLDESMRVCADTMLEPFGAYEAVRDAAGVITDFEIVHVNEAACLDIAVPREEQVGRLLCARFPAIRESGYFDKYCGVVNTGIPLIEDAFERGGRFWDMRVSRLGVGFVVSGRDVTQREHSLAAIREARLAAEEAERSKDQFLATISHELRTPLTAVLGYVQMLQKGAVPADRQASVIETINRNARLQLQLIDDILDVSAIIRGKVTLEMTRLDLKAILEGAIDSVLPATEGKQLRLIRELAAGDAAVIGDARRLHQVFGNVLTNAVKFTRTGGEIRADMRLDGDVYEITIADSGVGISAQFLPHIFEEFSQADAASTRKHGGLGLGLHIAQFLIGRHGGTIAAESSGAGHGATFRIRLPRA